MNNQIDETVLRELYKHHREHVSYLQDKKLNIRLPNMPEHISENIVKFIIQNKLGDKTCKWSKDSKTKISGDLYSEKEKIQEVKCFTSTGPPSFGPTEKWDVIYFLDMIKWNKDILVLYRIRLSNKSLEWRNLKVNEKQTFGNQADVGKRPRLVWKSIQKQLSTHIEEIYRGTFNDIFNENNKYEEPKKEEPKKEEPKKEEVKKEEVKKEEVKKEEPKKEEPKKEEVKKEVPKKEEVKKEEVKKEVPKKEVVKKGKKKPL
jgi:hypothetical protein